MQSVMGDSWNNDIDTDGILGLDPFWQHIL